jgi:hypothetical protein
MNLSKLMKSAALAIVCVTLLTLSAGLVIGPMLLMMYFHLSPLVGLVYIALLMFIVLTVAIYSDSD